MATDKPARVLVVYATRHGAARGIAERIAATLRESGAEMTVRPIGQAGDPADYDAVVVGSALYYFRWLKGGHRVRAAQQCRAGRAAGLALQQRPARHRHPYRAKTVSGTSGATQAASR